MIKSSIAIIQARMSSSRLPGKVLMPLAGNPVIWHIYKRAESCRYVEKVVVATSTEESDDPLAEYCSQKGMNVFRGSLDNVLDRFIKILQSENYPYYVRITGDCPLIDPDFIDQQIIALNKYNGDLLWTQHPGSLYEGQGVHSSQSLFEVAANSENEKDREHAGSDYFVNHPEKFRIVEFIIPENLITEDFRITIDEEADYRLIGSVYEALWDGQPIPLEKAVNFLRKHPEISKINKDVRHKDYNLQIKQIKANTRPESIAGSFLFGEQ